MVRDHIASLHLGNGGGNSFPGSGGTGGSLNSGRVPLLKEQTNSIKDSALRGGGSSSGGENSEEERTGGGIYGCGEPTGESGRLCDHCEMIR